MKLDVITTAFAATLIQLSFVTTSNRKGSGSLSVVVQTFKYSKAGPAFGPFPSRTKLGIRGFHHLGVQVNAASSDYLHLSFPAFVAGLLHHDGALALWDLKIGRRVARKISIDFDVGSVRNRGDRQLCR